MHVKQLYRLMNGIIIFIILVNLFVHSLGRILMLNSSVCLSVDVTDVIHFPSVVLSVYTCMYSERCNDWNVVVVPCYK